MAKYNERKLKRLINERRGLHAEYLALSEEIRFARSDLVERDRQIREADKATEFAINREIFRAREENRQPKEIKLFVDLTVDEMLDTFNTHPIKDRINKSTVEAYVALRKELEDLTERQQQISVRLNPLIGLTQSCKDFLEQNGVSHHGITV